MRMNGNLNMAQNQVRNLALESVSVYPSNPVQGQTIFKDGRVMICLEINGDVPVWIPLTATVNTHIHTQSVAATTWTVDHDLGTADAVVQIQDTNGVYLIPDSIVQTHNQCVITFTTAQAGRAVLMLGQEEGSPRPEFAYEQSFTDSSTWVVTHMLGRNPVLRVFIGNHEVQPLSIVHDDLNNTTVTFSAPQTGSVKAI